MGDLYRRVWAVRDDAEDTNDDAEVDEDTDSDTEDTDSDTEDTDATPRTRTATPTTPIWILPEPTNTHRNHHVDPASLRADQRSRHGCGRHQLQRLLQRSPCENMETRLADLDVAGDPNTREYVSGDIHFDGFVSCMTDGKHTHLSLRIEGVSAVSPPEGMCLRG